MRTIRLTSWIHAPMERCFRLSLSIEMQAAAARTTGEQFSSGVRSGPVGLNDMTTRGGRYRGLKFQHTNLMDVVRPSTFFREVMVEGTFSRFEHEHHFAALNDGTRVRDEIRFSCRGVTAELTEMLLRRRLAELVRMRNRAIRQAAESTEWQKYLPSQARRGPATVNERESALRA